MSELSTRKIGLLLQVEPWIFTSLSTGDDGNWQCTLSRDIRRYRDVQTIEQYLEKREMLKSHASSPATEPAQRSIVVSEMWNLEIHPQIYARCWHLYNARKYDDAILNATKVLEVAVPTKAHLPADIVATPLINKPFKPNKPILRYNKIKPDQN